MPHAEGVGNFVQHRVSEKAFSPAHIALTAVPSHQTAVIGDGRRTFKTANQVGHKVVGVGFTGCGDFHKLNIGHGADFLIGTAHQVLQIRGVGSHRGAIHVAVVIVGQGSNLVQSHKMVFDDCRAIGIAAEGNTVATGVQVACFLNEIG